MPLRPPVCCKAVHRQLLTVNDSIWVSDEALSAAFQRFCSLSRTSRRYGSSVPGPMESRRRLGKRRMTHVSEGVPSSAHGLGSIWGSFWEPDRTQWQWQAPTPREPNPDSNAVALPSWLLEWDTTSQGRKVEEAILDSAGTGSAQHSATIEDDVRQFRETLRGKMRQADLTTSLRRFSATFKTNLTLGLVPMESIDFALRQISSGISRACSDGKVVSDLCLEFYVAVWEGIEISKVLGPQDIDIGVLDRLVRIVALLEVTPKMQALAHKILHSLSTNQLRGLARSISALVQSWSESWLSVEQVQISTEEIQLAGMLTSEAEGSLANAQRLVMALEASTLEKDIGAAVSALQTARTIVIEAINVTAKAADIISPLKVSIKALASTLGHLPHDMTVRLLDSCTRRIITFGDTLPKSSWSFRQHWLCVVAHMPNVTDNQLVRTWKLLDPSNDIRDNKCVDVILSHWVSRGKVGDSASVINTYEASSRESMSGKNSASFARLLLALDKHREMSFSRTGDLFYLLPRIGMQRKICDILYRMKEMGMKIPTTMLGTEIEKMSEHDTKRALDMWFLPWEMQSGYSLRPDFIPKFILSLVDDPHTPPGMIWDLMKIPIYNPRHNKWHRAPYTNFSKPLSKGMIDLIHQMARAFARSNARPPRVAFRNVIQCLHHLRMHNAPISPELSRAVTHIVSTQSIVRGEIIGLERLRYALYLVAKIEGEEVAKEVDQTVYKWRRLVKNKRIEMARDANPLRVGPIG